MKLAIELCVSLLSSIDSNTRVLSRPEFWESHIFEGYYFSTTSDAENPKRTIA